MRILKGEPVVIGTLCLVATFVGFSASKYELKNEVANNNELLVETSAKQNVEENIITNDLPMQINKADVKIKKIAYPCNKANSEIVEKFTTDNKIITKDYLDAMKYAPISKTNFPGVVFKTEVNSYAYASVEGTVKKIEKNKNGDYLEIEGANGFTVIYVGLSNIFVKENQTVEKGQRIGEVGNIGNVLLNNELRFFVLEDGKVIDPMKYMEK